MSTDISGKDRVFDAPNCEKPTESHSDIVCQGLGTIVGNLLSLELLLRIFLQETSAGQRQPGPKLVRLESVQAGEWVPEDYLTNYSPLRPLIAKVNKELETRRRRESVDPSLADLRDALAHGRVFLGAYPAGLFRLVKFSEPKNHRVQVAVCSELTDGWLESQIQRTQEASINLEVVLAILFPGAVSRALGTD
jgi:hypothetical protein